MHFSLPSQHAFSSYYLMHYAKGIMKAVIQRVLQAKVEVDTVIVGEISTGLCVLLGIGSGDTEDDLDYLIKKIVGMRIFADQDEKMNLSVSQVKGSVLLISQFTLHANTSKGNRPSYMDAAEPVTAEKLYNSAIDKIRVTDIPISTGKFGANMQVSLLNDGPVTILLDSKNR